MRALKNPGIKLDQGKVFIQSHLTPFFTIVPVPHCFCSLMFHDSHISFCAVNEDPLPSSLVEKWLEPVLSHSSIPRGSSQCIRAQECLCTCLNTFFCMCFPPMIKYVAKPFKNSNILNWNSIYTIENAYCQSPE